MSIANLTYEEFSLKFRDYGTPFEPPKIIEKGTMDPYVGWASHPCIATAIYINFADPNTGNGYYNTRNLNVYIPLDLVLPAVSTLSFMPVISVVTNGTTGGARSYCSGFGWPGGYYSEEGKKEYDAAIGGDEGAPVSLSPFKILYWSVKDYDDPWAGPQRSYDGWRSYTEDVIWEPGEPQPENYFTYWYASAAHAGWIPEYMWIERHRVKALAQLPKEHEDYQAPSDDGFTKFEYGPVE